MNNTIKTTLQTFALGLALAAFALPAAQAGSGPRTHTFVSSGGSDANSTNGNACSRTSPCATFQGALQATLPGGLVSVIDSGDYGPMMISQNVTVDGTGSNAAITLTANSTAVFNSGSNATVTLRHLTLAGPGGANNNAVGIAVNNGHLLVDGCKISGFGFGLAVGGGSLVVQNTTITNCTDGILGSPALLSVCDSTFQGNTVGMDLDAGQTDVSRCTITQNSGNGLGAQSSGTAATLTATGCTISGNGMGVAAGSGATVNLNDNDVWNNTTGFATFGSGIIATAGNNRKAGNTTPGAPTPGATVTVQ